MVDERQPPQSRDIDTEAENLGVDFPPTEGTFVEGAELGGRYRIWTRLGAGGMGEIRTGYTIV